jgi:hypothetical protein
MGPGSVSAVRARYQLLWRGTLSIIGAVSAGKVWGSRLRREERTKLKFNKMCEEWVSAWRVQWDKEMLMLSGSCCADIRVLVVLASCVQGKGKRDGVRQNVRATVCWPRGRRGQSFETGIARRRSSFVVAYSAFLSILIFAHSPSPLGPRI